MKRTAKPSAVVPLHTGQVEIPKLVDADLEMQVIGAVLSNNALFRDACFLEPEHFNDENLGELWGAVLGLLMDGKPATVSTLLLSLGNRVDALGGRDLLNSLAALGGMVAPALGDAAERLRRLAQWRRFFALRNEMSAWVERMSPDDAFSALVRESELAIQSGRSTARSKREVARSAIRDALEPRELVTTGIDSLDFLMQGGLIRKRMYGIGGEFGRGKTILVGTISENLNAQRVSHLVIAMETPPEDMEIRNCARRLDLNAAHINDQTSKLHKRFVANAERYIDQMPDHTFYEYMPGRKIDDIERVIIRAVHKYGIQGFILDFLQLVGGREKGQSEDAHLRAVADRLAALCRRENIWGLVTAQVDQYGNLRYSDALKISAALYMRLVREENEQTAFFLTEKSNYTRYADTGSEANPNLLFDLRGPHFRNAEAEDYAQQAQAEQAAKD